MTAPPSAVVEEQLPPQQRAWRRLRENPIAWIGGGITLMFLLCAVGAEWVAPHPVDRPFDEVAQPPSAAHWLGTDSLRKDVLTRVIHGARLSLLAGTLSIVVAMVVGVPLGAIAGFFPGRIDMLLMRGIDVLLAFPSVLIALLFAAALRPGWGTVICAVGLINVPAFARQVRATVLTVRHLEYVTASRAFGATPWRILWSEICPSLINPVLVLASLGIGAAILEVAGLSFLGIGGDPTEAEWGSMLAQSKDYWSKNRAFAMGPGAAISLAVLGFNLLGDALRDALDPHAPNKHHEGPT
jgi:peptide/nickel transport system permease protein